MRWGSGTISMCCCRKPSDTQEAERGRGASNWDVAIVPGHRGEQILALHKKILEWQAEHPITTWVGWGIVWAIVLVALLWPRIAH